MLLSSNLIKYTPLCKPPLNKLSAYGKGVDRLTPHIVIMLFQISFTWCKFKINKNWIIKTLKSDFTEFENNPQTDDIYESIGIYDFSFNIELFNALYKK